jgi:hypothetical protein
MKALDFLKEEKKDAVSFLGQGESATDFLNRPESQKSGLDLLSMPEEGPAQRPPMMNQMKVYRMLEGMPAELATGIKKSALEYEREQESGTISMPEVSLPKSLWEGFKNIPTNIKEIIRDTSSALMLVGKGVGGASWRFGKDVFEDLNKTFAYQAELKENAKAELPDYKAFERIERLPGQAKAIKKGVKKFPEQIANYIADELEESKNIGHKRYLYKMIENHPVDILLVGNAAVRAAGEGTRIGLMGVGKVFKSGSKVANRVENILSTERVPLVYNMPAEMKGEEIIAKTIKFSREYSKDPILKYTFQKSFDNVLEKRPKLAQALAGRKAEKSLYELRRAYDQAGVQERIALHREIDQMLSTLSKDELKVAVGYLEGRLPLSNPTDEFKQFEGWYRNLMEESRETLGLEQSDEILYGPLAKATGLDVETVKKEFGDWFRPEYVGQAAVKSEKGTIKTGRGHYEAYDKLPLREQRSVQEGYLSTEGRFVSREEANKAAGSMGEDIDAADMLSVKLREGKPPAYVHQVHEKKFPLKMSVHFPDTTGKRFKAGILKKRQVGEGYSEDLKVILPKWASEYVKFKNTEAFVKDYTSKYGIPVNFGSIKYVNGGLKVGDKVYKDYKIIAPDGYLRFYNNKFDAYKEISKKLGDMTFDEAIADQLSNLSKIQETTGPVEKSSVGVTKNLTVYLLPEDIAKRLDSWATPRFNQRTHDILKIVHDKPVGVWKDSVLAVSPRWIKNNVVGDILFNSIENVGPLSYTRAFSAKYTKLIPDELNGASFAEVMKYNPKLGMAAKTTVGKLMKDLGESGTVKGIAKVKDAGYAVNTAFEKPFVRAFYINRARKKAKQLLKAQGQPTNEAAILYKMEEIKNSKTLREPILKELKETLPVFDLLGPQERKYIRGFMPFYNWFKFMAKYGAKLPVKHPFKTVGGRGLGALSELERETAFKQYFPEMKDYIEENGIPNRYDGLWPIGDKDENGESIFFNTRGMNPFTTFEDFVESDFLNMMSPVIKLGVERMTGRETFTNREYRTGEKGRGKFKEFEKENPPLGEHILRMFPQYQLLKEYLVPAKQWDSGTIFNPDPILDKLTGEYKYPIKSVEKIFNYLGIDKRTIDIEDSWSKFQKKRQEAIGETFGKQQSKYEKYLTDDDIRDFLNHIKSDPVQWAKIEKLIKENKRLKAKQKQELIRKLRGE